MISDSFIKYKGIILEFSVYGIESAHAHTLLGSTTLLKSTHLHTAPIIQLQNSEYILGADFFTLKCFFFALKITFKPFTFQENSSWKQDLLVDILALISRRKKSNND